MNINKRFLELSFVVLLGITIYLCFRNYNLSNQVSYYENHYQSRTTVGATKTDTVYLSKPFKAEADLPLAVVPSKITYYSGLDNTNLKTTSTKSSSVVEGADFSAFASSASAYLAENGSSTICYSAYEMVVNGADISLGSRADTSLGSSFNRSSLVQFSLTRNLLKLTTLAADSSSIATTEYQLDLGLYRYLYKASSGNITAEKVSSFFVCPYIEYKLRLPNAFSDLSGGIQFKTKTFNYKLGIDLSYYPTISSKIYKDIEFSFTYNF